MAERLISVDVPVRFMNEVGEYLMNGDSIAGGMIRGLAVAIVDGLHDEGLVDKDSDLIHPVRFLPSMEVSEERSFRDIRVVEIVRDSLGEVVIDAIEEIFPMSLADEHNYN